jgi:hypothetical protein
VKALVKAIVSRRTPRLINRRGGAMVKEEGICAGKIIMCEMYNKNVCVVKIALLRVTYFVSEKRDSSESQNSKLHRRLTQLALDVFYNGMS